jgi:hypothetical protein
MQLPFFMSKRETSLAAGVGGRLVPSPGAPLMSCRPGRASGSRSFQAAWLRPGRRGLDGARFVGLAFSVSFSCAALGCGPSQPESCIELEAKASTPESPPACSIADACKAGGDYYRTREGTDSCDTSCKAVLAGGGCDSVGGGEGERG